MAPRRNRFFMHSRMIESKDSKPPGNRSLTSMPLALTLFASQTQVHRLLAPSVRANPVIEFNVTPQLSKLADFITVSAFSNKWPLARSNPELRVFCDIHKPQVEFYRDLRCHSQQCLQHSHHLHNHHPRHKWLVAKNKDPVIFHSVNFAPHSS